MGIVPERLSCSRVEPTGCITATSLVFPPRAHHEAFAPVKLRCWQRQIIEIQGQKAEIKEINGTRPDPAQFKAILALLPGGNLKISDLSNSELQHMMAGGVNWISAFHVFCARRRVQKE
jgi:hypothetical protein